TMESHLFVFAFVLATCIWQVQPAQLSIPDIDVLGFVLGCSAQESGSLCAQCERACGVEENVKCANRCRPGCICNKRLIRKNGRCVSKDQCPSLGS
ncbi:hypothetical protein KR074_007008, partial [Drosophila pseudoananassae]